jgi:hypothetical protein
MRSKYFYPGDVLQELGQFSRGRTMLCIAVNKTFSGFYEIWFFTSQTEKLERFEWKDHLVTLQNWSVVSAR